MKILNCFYFYLYLFLIKIRLKLQKQQILKTILDTPSPSLRYFYTLKTIST